MPEEAGSSGSEAEYGAHHLEAIIVDGVCYLDASSVSLSLRQRASEIAKQANDLGENPEGEDEITQTAYYCLATELGNRADWLDVAVMEFVTNKSEEKKD